MLPQYTPGDAARYADSQGWAYKRTGSHIILKQCPWCGKNDKFYWNDETGAFDCKSAACGQAGNYYTLRRDLGDPVIQDKKLTALKQAEPKRKRFTFAQYATVEKQLEQSQAALDYLASRGISVESAKKWKLGYKREEEEEHRQDGVTGPIEWLLIPYITQQSDIADVKYRSMPPAPKRFKRKGGGESILYGEHLLPARGKRNGAVDTLYLCEGELDAITLDQHGFSPALSTTVGAATFPPRWYDLIVSSGAKRIVLVYDSDVDGQAAAEKLAKKFTDADREVVNVILPLAKDANEYFTGNAEKGIPAHTADDFNELIKSSRPVEFEYCLSMASVLDQLEEQLFMSGGELNGYKSVHENINDLIDGGYAKGQLITVIGGSGTGKTTLVQQDLLNIATVHGPTYFMCLEMPPVRVLAKAINHLYHIPIRDIKQHHIQQYRADLERRGFFFGAGRFRNIDQLAEVFIKAHKRYGFCAIGFDNIHYLCRDTKNQAAEISNTTKGFKDLAVELDVPLIAIGQPGKFDRSERIINENDVKGSSAIEQDSDYMMLMWRPPLRTSIDAFGATMGEKENMSPLTYIRVGKARYSPGGETLLYFHGDISTFRALSDAEREQLVAEAAANRPDPDTKKGRGRGKN